MQEIGGWSLEFSLSVVFEGTVWFSHKDKQYKLAADLYQKCCYERHWSVLCTITGVTYVNSNDSKNVGNNLGLARKMMESK